MAAFQEAIFFPPVVFRGNPLSPLPISSLDDGVTGHGLLPPQDEPDEIVSHGGTLLLPLMPLLPYVKSGAAGEGVVAASPPAASARAPLAPQPARNS